MLVIAFGAIVYAQPASAAFVNQNQPSWTYVEPSTLPPTLLPAPPDPTSIEGRRQMQVIRDAQKHLTKADRAAAFDEQHIRLELMTQMLGSDFTHTQKPKTFALLDHVMADVRTISENDKNFWHTKRPYLVDKRVKLLVDPLDSSPAYPSGHTCFARVIAEVLGLIYPNRIGELRNRADDIAWHRVQAGVHYPGDLDGGRALAMLIMGSLMQSDAFLDGVEDAKEEAIQH